MALAGTAVFIALSGSAVAASGLIHAGDIAPGAVTSKAIKNGTVEPVDLSTATRALLPGAGTAGAAGAKGEAGSSGATGSTGAKGAEGTNGAAGAAGSNGANGANGPTGAAGANGTNGVDGTNGPNGANGAAGVNGANGANGAAGANGANGVDGTNGAKGVDGVNGKNGTNGTDGTNGTITPLSASAGVVALPTSTLPTTIVSLPVAAGNYVVLAKTELSQTGAGDTVECMLKSGSTTVDQVAMKTLPALAAVPASMQAVVKITSPSQLSVECKVSVANGSTNYTSIIAIPTA